jgi:hypothetical protein
MKYPLGGRITAGASGGVVHQPVASVRGTDIARADWLSRSNAPRSSFGCSNRKMMRRASQLQANPQPNRAAQSSPAGSPMLSRKLRG